MKFRNLALVAAVFFLFSCQKNKEIEPTQLEEDSTGQYLVNPETTNQSINSPAVAQSVTIPQADSPEAKKAGLNPEHGQPGHRCDIPVGAPLNSTVQKKPNTPAATQQPITVNPAASRALPKQETAPGMNPPHGEAGHRCDIPVGQPLNSKPAATSTPTAPSQTLPATVAAPKTEGDK